MPLYKHAERNGPANGATGVPGHKQPGAWEMVAEYRIQQGCVSLPVAVVHCQSTGGWRSKINLPVQADEVAHNRRLQGGKDGQQRGGMGQFAAA